MSGRGPARAEEPRACGQGRTWGTGSTAAWGCPLVHAGTGGTAQKGSAFLLFSSVCGSGAPEGPRGAGLHVPKASICTGPGVKAPGVPPRPKAGGSLPLQGRKGERGEDKAEIRT